MDIQNNNELPEKGELILANVLEIQAHGVYVDLEEFFNLKGYLHRSEISTGWVRHVERHVRVGQKIVLKVIRVNSNRREVDLSLRQVTQEERRRKIIDVKQSEKANALLEETKTKLNLSDEEIRIVGDKLERKFGSLYTALEAITKDGIKTIEEVDLQSDIQDAIEQIAKERIAIPEITIKGVIEVSCNEPNGVDMVKDALHQGEKADTKGVKIDISYLASAKYQIAVKAQDYKTAEKAVQQSINEVKKSLGKKGQSFSFTRFDGRN